MNENNESSSGQPRFHDSSRIFLILISGQYSQWYYATLCKKYKLSNTCINMAASGVNVSGGAEIYFAKKLASNEKTVRDKAVKKLRTWISTGRSVSSGLFHGSFHDFNH